MLISGLYVMMVAYFMRNSGGAMDNVLQIFGWILNNSTFSIPPLKGSAQLRAKQTLKNV
jgi:hypothetical protein